MNNSGREGKRKDTCGENIAGTTKKWNWLQIALRDRDTGRRWRWTASPKTAWSSSYWSSQVSWLGESLVVESKHGLIIVNSFQESLQPLSPGALCYFAGRGYTLNQSFTGTETSNLSFTFLLQMESSLLSPWGAPQLCCTESCHCEIKATEILKVLWKLVRSKMREDYTACGVGVALRECNKCENERPWRYSVIWSPLFTLLSSCHRLHHRFHCKPCFCQLEARCHPATCHISALISRTRTLVVEVSLK